MYAEEVDIWNQTAVQATMIGRNFQSCHEINPDKQ